MYPTVKIAPLKRATYTHICKTANYSLLLDSGIRLGCHVLIESIHLVQALDDQNSTSYLMEGGHS